MASCTAFTPSLSIDPDWKADIRSGHTSMVTSSATSMPSIPDRSATSPTKWVVLSATAVADFSGALTV